MRILRYRVFDEKVKQVKTWYIDPTANSRPPSVLLPVASPPPIS